MYITSLNIAHFWTLELYKFENFPPGGLGTNAHFRNTGQGRCPLVIIPNIPQYMLL